MEDLAKGLPGELFQKIVESLTSAYTSISKLKMFLRYKLNWTLSTSTGELNDVAFEVVNDFEAQGRLEELLRKARDDTPGNTNLQNAYNNYKQYLQQIQSATNSGEGQKTPLPETPAIPAPKAPSPQPQQPPVPPAPDGEEEPAEEEDPTLLVPPRHATLLDTVKRPIPRQFSPQLVFSFRGRWDCQGKASRA